MNRLLAYLRLLRVTNVFTAIADVVMGILVSTGGWPAGLVPWLLVATSLALYLAGMVLNDYFDAEIDRQERPERPIPSGSVSRPAAGALGGGLLLAGILLAAMAAVLTGRGQPLTVGVLLAATILVYDSGGKASLAGPLLMGSCRTLNVGLGLTLAELPWLPPTAANRWGWFLAGGIGLYVAGVTWFARHEAVTSRPRTLAAGLAVMLAGLAWLMALPWIAGPPPTLQMDRADWVILWVLVTAIIARPAVLAVVQPSAARVQAAVGNAILSLPLIDAAVCVGYLGVYWGCAVLLLVFPALLLRGIIRPT